MQDKDKTKEVVLTEEAVVADPVITPISTAETTTCTIGVRDLSKEYTIEEMYSIFD